jgi:glycosyltransferase involved in cell wall biosynthesis
VVPAFNEADKIARTIRSIPGFVDHVLVVDDGSADATAKIAARSGRRGLEVIVHPANRGVGAAIATGYRRALALEADATAVMAGDAQMDPAYLPDLLDKVTASGFGFSKANRFFAPESFEGMPRHRVFGNIVLSFMTKLASGYWHLFDPQNGYTAVRTEVLKRIPLDHVAKRYSFENDLLIHLNIQQVSAVDVPVPAVYGEEVSSISLRKVVPELMNLLFAGFWRRIWYRYVLWSFSPIALLLFLGLAAFLFGLGVAIWIGFVIVGSIIATAGTVMLAALPLMIGTQMLISALQLDIQASPSTPNFTPYD